MSNTNALNQSGNTAGLKVFETIEELSNRLDLKMVPVTKSQWDNLPDSKYSDGICYIIISGDKDIPRPEISTDEDVNESISSLTKAVTDGETVTGNGLLSNPLAIYDKDNTFRLINVPWTIDFFTYNSQSNELEQRLNNIYGIIIGDMSDVESWMIELFSSKEIDVRFKYIIYSNNDDPGKIYFIKCDINDESNTPIYIHELDNNNWIESDFSWQHEQQYLHYTQGTSYKNSLLLNNFEPYEVCTEPQILINYFEDSVILRDLYQKTLNHVQRILKIREVDKTQFQEKISDLQKQIDTVGGTVYTYDEYLTAKKTGTLPVGLIVISDQ